MASRIARWSRYLRLQALTGLMTLSRVPLVGGLSLRLAEWWVGPYKERRMLAQLSPHGYISSRAQCRCARLVVGRGCFIDDNVTIYGHDDAGEIRLGDRVHVYRGTIVEAGAGGSVIIGPDTHIQSSCNLKGFLCNLIIGANVQIAPQCAFSPYEHCIDNPDQLIQAQGIRSSGDIVLEDDVWLGLGVKVLEGVRIGRGAVIGAGAVVTKSVPPNAVAVGVPARVIRTRGKA